MKVPVSFTYSGKKKVTWHDILLMMIGTSDNYCTNLIISHVGMETLNQVFTEDLSLIDTHLGRKMMSRPDKASNRDNWMVAADLVRCFEVIEDFNQQERKFSEEMLLNHSYLSRAKQLLKT